MTVHVTFRQTCDRCARPFNERLLKAGETVPVVKAKGWVLYSTQAIDGKVETAATPRVEFTDLCPGCSEALDKIIDRMLLDSSKKPKASKAAAPSSAVTAAAPPSMPKRKRGRPSKADLAARAAAEEKARAEAEAEEKADASAVVEEYTEPEPESKPEPKAESEGEALGLAGDAESSEESLEDPFADRETFEDPETGDLVDVHTGEILAKREREAKGKQKDAHPF